MISPLEGRRVLLVEDELIVSWLLVDMLCDLGCVVVGPAARIDEALAMLQAGAPDAALLDVNLDGERSFAVADALMAIGVPFAFATGYADDRLPDKYRTIPKLQKPFHDQELSETITNLLSSGAPG